MIGAKPNLKDKASKALETVKNDPRAQKAGQKLKDGA